MVEKYTEELAQWIKERKVPPRKDINTAAKVGPGGTCLFLRDRFKSVRLYRFSRHVPSLPFQV